MLQLEDILCMYEYIDAEPSVALTQHIWRECIKKSEQFEEQSWRYVFHNPPAGWLPPITC